MLMGECTVDVGIAPEGGLNSFCNKTLVLIEVQNPCTYTATYATKIITHITPQSAALRTSRAYVDSSQRQRGDQDSDRATASADSNFLNATHLIGTCSICCACRACQCTTAAVRRSWRAIFGSSHTRSSPCSQTVPRA
jgi:hypothetical protein